MIKHTAGPWEPKGRFVMNREGNTLCEVKYPYPCGMTAEIIKATDEEHANARLIAAAPELLEALDQLTTGETGRKIRKLLGSYQDDSGQWVDVNVIKNARAAIAKATGEG